MIFKPTIIFLFEFFTICVAQLSKWIDYRLIDVFSDDPAPKCITTGAICGDCSHIYQCDNQNTSSIVVHCPYPQMCNNGICTIGSSAFCPPTTFEFICTMEGVFPDPMDCFKYHTCSGTEDKKKVTKICNHNFKYDVRTSNCQEITKSDACVTYVIPLCVAQGQTGSLDENPSMYYVCKPLNGKSSFHRRTSLQSKNPSVLYPYLYICENGKIYDDTFNCKR